jgi:hypothetical protein
MKIISQSADELVLKEGSASGIIVGIVLVIAGLLVEVFIRPSNPIFFWVGLAIVAAGVAIIFYSSSITVTANKTSGQVLYEKKRLAGGKSTTYAIADIFRIETRKQWRVQNSPPANNQSASAPQTELVAQSVIVFKNGNELALDHQKTSSSMSVGGAVIMGGQGAETAIAAQVANFLNVPFQEVMPPNMGSGINIQI